MRAHAGILVGIDGAAGLDHNGIEPVEQFQGFLSLVGEIEREGETGP